MLEYRHDRADLRGLAWLICLGGLAGLAIVLPIVHKHVPDRAAAITASVAGLVWLASWGVVAWQARRVRGRTETIVFDDTGFTSRLFGRIDFADVTAYQVGCDTKLWRWEIQAPSVTLRLADRQRLHFHLDARHHVTDLLDYVAFVEELRACLDDASYVATSAGALGCARVFGDAVPEARPSPARPTTATRARSSRRRSSPGAASDEAAAQARQSAAGRLSRANRDAAGRFRAQMQRNSKWVVLAGVLLPLTYMIRVCDPSAIKSVIAPSPLHDLSKRAPAELDRNAVRLRRAIVEKGPVYLWSNTDQDTVKPLLVPNIRFGQSGFDSLDTMSAAGRILSFLINDEVEGYRMGVQHDDTLTPSRYTEISLRPVAGEKTLFFFLLPPAGYKPSGANARAMPDITWRVQYRDVGEIPERIDQASMQLPMPLIARWMQHKPAPRLMVAAARYHHMTDADFAAAVAEVKQDFARRGIDTSAFHTRRFANGAVRQGADGAGHGDHTQQTTESEAGDGR
ncbi:hypothetical protein D3260_07975 [Salinisphaera sp. Q1T1-3]|nr:hypothetical protein D3260_07975 [Salinisphaera sp. Q1T1-3]